MKVFAVTKLICLLGSVAVKATDCPDLWIPYHGGCYWFGHQAMTFFEAEHYCQQHQSHIVHIETEEENLFLRNELSLFQANKMWIGLTDDDIEGIWEWYGTDTTAEYTDWLPGQPSSTAEDCGEILKTSQGTHWNDVSCHSLRIPICEKTVDNGAIIG